MRSGRSSLKRPGFLTTQPRRQLNLARRFLALLDQIRLRPTPAPIGLITYLPRGGLPGNGPTKAMHGQGGGCQPALGLR